MSVQLNDHETWLMQLLGLYHLTARTLRDADATILKGYDITPRQFYVLNTLYQYGPMHIGEIIEKNHSTSGNMTVVIRNMERDGYITRISDPADRRSSLISLTEVGKDLIVQLFPKLLSHIEEIVSDLTAQEQEELIQILRKVTRSGEKELQKSGALPDADL